MTGAIESGDLAHLRHELRTPVNHILGYAEILIEDAAQRNLQAFVPAFEQIRDDGHRLLASIQKALGPQESLGCLEVLEVLKAELRATACEALHRTETLRGEMVRVHEQTLADVG